MSNVIRTTLSRAIAAHVWARENCRRTGNTEWFDRHSNLLTYLEREYLPRGSGIDAGTTIDRDRSGPDRIVLITSFHHMNDAGMYDGWTTHTIVVRPAFDGLDIRVTGRNRNGIKEYLGDLFASTLRTPLITTPTGYALDPQEGGPDA